MNPGVKPVVLVVLDGWGHREDTEHNAIAEAKTPFFNFLWKTYPHALLNASEESVGLPEGQMGNSEVGHMTIGAGKVIDTDLVRITKAMRAGDFNTNDAFKKLFQHCLSHDSMLHVIGLVSTGGVHSHVEHLYGFLRAAKEAGITKVAIHAITDGRDTLPRSGADYLAELEKNLKEIGVGKIATVCGRYFAMDRDKNWDRLLKAEDVMFRNAGEKTASTPSEHLRKKYESGVIDELLEPAVCMDLEGGACAIQKNDGVCMFNFRADRARMLSSRIAKMCDTENIYLVTMTEYDKQVKTNVAFPQVPIGATLAAEVSKAGLTQAHIAETEKYAHATYFLNGGREQLHDGEEHVLVESRKDIATHDQAPEMRAKEITDAAIDRIKKGVDFIFINYANADMVGHTANKPAIVQAVETVDRELKRLVEAVLEAGGALFITADHGNAELNMDTSGEKHTAHTMNAVPAILTLSGKLKDGGLSDVAPTVLSLLGIKQPRAMTGINLFRA
ncbi:2,3-bisphosphoglycerate-independent phosphoglycerate mutase [Candidatus Kaiserbacteria bacterium]|nr:2,3-bisphosphoglycerate-independent phosphoglycerate mutase [Candidatus Kaiserbacteria bacterium]